MYRLYFNGVSKGILNNNGHSGCGGIITDSKSHIYKKTNIICSYKKYLGMENTNYAEFMGLLYGLKYAKQLNIKNIEIFGDSKLVIGQCCNSQFLNNINSETKNIYYKIKNIEKEFERIEYHHIYEENNLKANKQANSSLKEYFNTIKII